LNETDRELDTLLTKVPAVFLDREHPEGIVDTVTCAHDDAVTQALLHLDATEHDVVTIIDRPTQSYPGRSSAAAIARFAAGSTMTIRHLPAAALTADEAYDALVSGVVREGAARSAVVATSGPLMIGALRGLGVLGLKPGRDVSVIGTDDSPLAAVFEPPLTALYRDLNLIGASLADLLLDRAATPPGPPEPRHIRVPMRLIRRSSVLGA
jgi:DNA-binding LacI/PurR family transcriptional regulator